MSKVFIDASSYVRAARTFGARPAVMDSDVLSFNEAASFAKASLRSRTESSGVRALMNPTTGIAARRDRPCRCCAAEQRDDGAAVHSMTSSARVSSLSGTPSGRAREPS